MKRNFQALVLISLSGILLLVVGPRRAFSQEKDAAQETEPRCGLITPFDVYGSINWEEEEARLDNWVIALQNETTMKGYMMVYVGKDDFPGIITRLTVRPANYLVESRGISAERFQVINGGYREKREIELWLIPQGVDPPMPSNTIEFKRDETQPYQFDQAYFDVAIDEELEPQQTAAPIDKQEGSANHSPADAATEAATEIMAEAQNSDGSEAGADDEVEESADASTDSDEPAAPVKLDLFWCSKCFANALNAERKTRGYFIYYYDSENPDNNQIREIVERERTKLAEKYQIDSWRLDAFYGGYRASPLLELWIGPENGPRPTLKNYPRPTPVENQDEDGSDEQP